MEPPNTLPYNLPADAVWFITGCSSGIGLALAQHIITTKNRVVATARNLASLSSLPDDSPQVLKLQLDVTSTASINAALDAVLAKFGRLDVVVNNAGYNLVGNTEFAGDEESRTLMETNFWGMVNINKRAIGIMRDVNSQQGQQGGVILNMSSMGGWMGFPGNAFYHASKFAMEGWTESVAKELPSSWNIHLCNIEPGGVKTNFASSSMKEIAIKHPAYADPSFPANVLKAFITDSGCTALWAEPKNVAAAMYKLVGRGGRIPIRMPLGSDAWGTIDADLAIIRKDLDEFKTLSFSTGDPEQLNTIDFLLK